MKIDARRLDKLLVDPAGFRGVLVFGADPGLARARARRLIAAVAGSTDDPFRIATLSRESVSGVTAELSAGALTGGRRVVHLPDATDVAAGPIKAALARSWAGFLVAEAGELPTRSKLRALFEAEPALAAVPCHPMDGAELAAWADACLRDLGVRADPEALAWLAAHLPPERGGVEGELRRLALFLHPGATARLADVQQCFGQGGGAAVGEALLLAATTGDVAGVDNGLTEAFAEGASPVGLLVTACGHMHRLHRVLLHAASGPSLAEAMRALRPPVFYRSQPAFLRSLALWPAEACAAAGVRLAAAEMACKQTGAPAEHLARAAVMALAAAARRRAR